MSWRGCTADQVAKGCHDARLPMLTAALLLLAGCSNVNWAVLGPEPTNQAEHQDDTLVREFEARRNAVQMQAAEAALERGDYRECERVLRSVLQRERTHRDARLLLAEVMLLTGRRPEAFTQLEHALRDHQEDPRVHYAMAVLLDASGRPEEATAFFGRSSELNPDFEVYASAHATVKSPDVSIATTGMEDTSASGPFAPAVAKLMREGREALSDGHVDSASSSFRAAMEAEPHNPQIPIRAAVFALEQNEPQVAVDLLKPASTRFPDILAVHQTLGVAYYRLGQYRSSQVVLRQALSLDNSNGLSYLLMGCTLEKLGQPKAAQSQWERAAELCPRLQGVRR